MRRHRSIERDFPHIVEIAVRRGWGGTRDAMKNFHARHGLQARPRLGDIKTVAVTFAGALLIGI
jgi:hypothetical protein